MKKIINSVFLMLTMVFIMSANFTPAKINEGKIVFSIETKFDETNEQMKMASQMMPKESTLYFKQNKTRMEMDMSMGNMIMLSADKNDFIMLMNFGGQKMGMRGTMKELKNMGKLKSQIKPAVFKATGKSKKIIGYECNEYSGTSEIDGKKYNLVCWTTEEIECTNEMLAPDYKGFSGFMLEFEMQEQGMYMHYTAKDLKTTAVADEKFIVPDGYEIKSVTEMMKKY